MMITNHEPLYDGLRRKFFDKNVVLWTSDTEKSSPATYYEIMQLNHRITKVRNDLEMTQKKILCRSY